MDAISDYVKDLALLTTIIPTLDQPTIIILNSKLTDDQIINYSTSVGSRLDLVVGVAYH